jgi:hypothetical protein
MRLLAWRSMDVYYLGLWHGTLLILGQVFLRNSNRQFKLQNRLFIVKAAGWFFTMFGVFFGWLIFRAQSLSHLGSLMKALVSGPLLRPLVIRENMAIMVAAVLFGTALVQTTKAVGLKSLTRILKALDIIRPILDPLVYALATSLIIITDTGSKAFVYFQF